MANTQHVKILKRGSAAWNKWRREYGRVILDLRGANLSAVDLSGANLSWADMSSARLSGASLVRAKLRSVKLRSASLDQTDLSQAHLIQADLGGANLAGANLRHAKLFHVNLTRSILRCADLSNAVVLRTILADADMTDAKGLDTVRHLGPSSIGLDTFFNSNGKIPAAFLRGAGVPEIFIQYAASLAGTAFDFYSCFISHSTKDKEFVERLHSDLQDKGVRCWYAPEDLKIGDKFRVEFDRAIRVHDKLLIVMSEHSVQSDWVEKEVEAAFEKERKEKRLVLFPIRVDDAIKDVEAGWAADIRRTRHIGDFRNWKDHDAYAKAFPRLLRDLKSDKPKPEPGTLH